MSKATVISAPAVVEPLADKQNAHGLWPLLVVPVAIAGLTYLWLGQAGQNYQEAVTLSIASHLGSSFFALLSRDNPMPLYYLLVYGLAHAIRLTLGELRVLSFAFYVLSVMVAYDVGRRAADDDYRVGLLAAALISLSPFMIWYSSRATMYSLLVLGVLINAYYFVGILRNQRHSWLGYILSGLFALGIHYFFVVILLTQFLFLFLDRHHVKGRTRYLVPLSFLLFVGAIAGWIYFTSLHIPIWFNLPATSKPSATNVFILFVKYLFGFQSVEVTTFVISFWPLLIVLALLAVQKYVSPPVAIRYFAFSAFVPVLGLFALGWITHPFFFSSYLIVCLPAFMMVVGWYLIAFELRMLAVARNILLVVMVLMLFLELINPQRALTSDYLGALDGSTAPGLPVTVPVTILRLVPGS